MATTTAAIIATAAATTTAAITTPPCSVMPPAPSRIQVSWEESGLREGEGLRLGDGDLFIQMFNYSAKHLTFLQNTKAGLAYGGAEGTARVQSLYQKPVGVSVA